MNNFPPEYLDDFYNRARNFLDDRRQKYAVGRYSQILTEAIELNSYIGKESDSLDSDKEIVGIAASAANLILENYRLTKPKRIEDLKREYTAGTLDEISFVEDVNRTIIKSRL